MAIKYLSDVPSNKKVELIRELLMDATGIQVDDVILVFKDGNAVVKQPEKLEDVGTLNFASSGLTVVDLIIMRGKKHMTQNEWAKHLGVHKSTVGKIEAGKAIEPATINAIEKGLKKMGLLSVKTLNRSAIQFASHSIAELQRMAELRKKIGNAIKTARRLGREPQLEL